MSLVTYRPRRFATPALFNNDFAHPFFNAEWPARKETPYVPAVNVAETETAFTLTFAVPGRKKEDLTLNVERNILTVSYKAEATAQKEAGTVHLREFFQKSFSRSFQLPETVQIEAIAADYTDGMLTVTLPKNAAEAPTTRSITIN